jgi:hypothetical protein
MSFRFKGLEYSLNPSYPLQTYTTFKEREQLIEATDLKQISSSVGITTVQEIPNLTVLYQVLNFASAKHESTKWIGNCRGLI